MIKVDAEKDLDFLGMTAMIDPPREEVVAAIQECKTAGIKTVMITGDQPLTATAVAERLGMIEAGLKAVVTGVDLEKLSVEDYSSLVKTTFVYARFRRSKSLPL